MALTLRLPENLEAAMKQLAEKHHRSTHGEIIQAVYEYVIIAIAKGEYPRYRIDEVQDKSFVTWNDNKEEMNEIYLKGGFVAVENLTEIESRVFATKQEALMWISEQK